MPKGSVQKKRKFSTKGLRNHIIYLCACCSLVVLMFLTSFNINSFLNENRVLGTQTQDLEKINLENDKAFWESFLSKNPTYLDGWIELSKIEMSLGDEGYTLGAYNTARAINPNSEKVKELGNLLPTK